MGLHMLKIFSITVAIIIATSAFSQATEAPTTTAIQKTNAPSSENHEEPDNPPPENNIFIPGDFIMDSNWVAVDLGMFEPHAINNSAHIAGDIVADKGGIFAGVWKQGFAEKLDGSVVTAQSSAVAINDSGQVVGYQKNRFGNNYEQAVLWNNGFMQELVALNNYDSRAVAINNSGEIVGWLGNNSRTKDAFVWRAGTMQYLGGLSSAIAINNTGQVLGTIEAGNPVLWNAGLMQTLQQPGEQEFTPLGAKQELRAKTAERNAPGRTSKKLKPPQAIVTPTCLNNAGQVSGYINNSHAFLWDNDDLQFLDSTDQGAFIPLAINNSGMLAGKINNKAAVWSKGRITELNKYFKTLRGWKSTEARGINDSEQIIVFATNNSSGKSKAFLLTPRSSMPIKGTEYADFEPETPPVTNTLPQPLAAN
jgi:probable HAF family extracellular repeat protein